MPSMVIDMNDSQLNTVADLSAFLTGTTTVTFALAANERYAFIERTLRRFGYTRLRRVDKAVVLRFLEHVSGYSRQQLTRLVERTRNGTPLTTRYRTPKGFTRTYTAADVALLAATDALHGTLSGPATKKLMERAYTVFDDAAYQRLAGLSVAHLYNLRQQAGYRKLRTQWTKTRPHIILIGQRRAPTPNGRPGYLRVDSVPGWPQGCLPHQRRRCGYSVRDRGELRAHQRGLSVAGTRTDARQLSLRHPGLPFR